MENRQDALFPDKSVATQVTLFVPIGKILPEEGIQTAVTPGQLSLKIVT